MRFSDRLQFWGFVALREWKTALLLVGIAGFFLGIYHILSNGIWNARRQPSDLVDGKVASLWTEHGYYSSLQPKAYIKVRLNNEQTITLRVRNTLISGCNPGDDIQIRIYTSEAQRVFYRLGPQICNGPDKELKE